MIWRGFSIPKGMVEGAKPLFGKNLPLPLIEGKGIKVEDSSRDRVT